MKRGTIDHPKLRALVAALCVTGRYQAVGILESLWHFTALYAWRGDVGKHSDAAITEWIGWTGSPDSLISALVKTGWLERTDTPARLVVHDWAEHCDDAVRMRMKREAQTSEHDGTSGNDVGTCSDKLKQKVSTRARLALAKAISQNGIGEEGEPGEPDRTIQTATQEVLSILTATGTWVTRGTSAELEIGRLVLSRGAERMIEEARWYGEHHTEKYTPKLCRVADLDKWGKIRAAMDAAAAAVPEPVETPCVEVGIY